MALKTEGKSVTDLGGAQVGDAEAVISADCDILIPAARPDVINISNAAKVKAKLVIQGANIPATIKAEAHLHQRGILVIPDFIANAGGVICASVEYHGGSETQSMNTIADKIRHNTTEVLENARAKGILPRKAAEELGIARIRQAMALGRFS